MASGAKTISNKLSQRGWKRKKGFETLRKSMKKSEISEELGGDRRTIYNWSARTENEKDYEDQKPKGIPQKLAKDQKDKLKAIIHKGPREYRYDTYLWTLKRTVKVIVKEFDVAYNTAYVWRVVQSLRICE